ncbi:restriction endonuclease [Candidatus Dojkabacteria bacterium]|nr:restriction endonuclease [Candidatus Dojkabacteria bacterium]
MTDKQKKETLNKAKKFFKASISNSHLGNTEKLVTVSEFNVNPFLVKYLAQFFTGNTKAESIAKVLIYPRILGTSINTTFGSRLQAFISEVLEGYGSTTAGIDIEFIDALDKRKKYCQVKAGSNTINKDDVKTIKDHFKSVYSLARTNNLKVTLDDMVVGVLYGTESELSYHYKKLQENYPVHVGSEFWFRVTGDKHFYIDLIDAFSEVAKEINGFKVVNKVVKELSEDIERNYSGLLL